MTSTAFDAVSVLNAMSSLESSYARQQLRRFLLSAFSFQHIVEKDCRNFQQ